MFRNKAILSYLRANGHKTTADSFLSETNILTNVATNENDDNVDNTTTSAAVILDDPKYKNLLEKKWTSVVRLQKKVKL